LLACMILSEHNDTRHVLQIVGYSSNPDEARVQVQFRISKLLAREDSSLIQSLNQGAFLQSWYSCIDVFLSGTLVGFGRMPEKMVIDRALKNLKQLSARGETIISELIKRMNAGAKGI
jgi:hypothetical protein